MKKSGFTLLELLAVIVVLAVIALIVTPFVTKAIDEAKKGAFKNSVYGIIDAAELYYASNLENRDEIPDIDVTTNTLKYKGEKPTSGLVRYDTEGKIKTLIIKGNNCAYKDFTEADIRIGTVTNGNCVIGSQTISIEGLEVVTQELALNIKNYSSLPASGTKNDIAIISDVEISSYYISYTEPTEKQENMVWIKIDTTSNVGIEGTTATTPIGKCYQYIDNNWVNKAGYIYNEEWQIFSNYTITYNLNGGTSQTPYSQTKFHDVNATITDIVPTRDKYTFVEWNTLADGTGDSYASSSEYQGNADITLYAKWASRIVTLFDSGTFGGGALSFTTNQYNNDFSSYFNISYDSDNNLVFTGTQTGGQANVILLPNLDFTDFKTVRIYLKNVSFTLPTQIIATVFSIEHPENLVGGYKTCQLACSAPAMATTSPQVLSIDVTNVNQNAAIMLISPDNRYASSGVITKIEIEYE